MSYRTIWIATIGCLGASAYAGETSATDAIWALRREASSANSEVIEAARTLNDSFGPRLTGSPNLAQARDWVVKQLAVIGLTAKSEPWSFGHDGWQNDRAHCKVLSPVPAALACVSSAWTPSTAGTITARVVQFPELATMVRDEGSREPGAVASDAVVGRAVMVEAPAAAVRTPGPQVPQLADEDIAEFDLVPVREPGALGVHSRVSVTIPGAAIPSLVTRRESEDAVLRASGASVRVIDSGRRGGALRADANPTLDPNTAVPTVVIRADDYAKIDRWLASGATVVLSVDVRNRSLPEGRVEYNLLADRVGTTRSSEVVVVGAHLDTWHVATGATDNTSGVAVVLEAARILQALQLPLSRTIRFAFWTGEEQGMLGSRAYVNRLATVTRDKVVAYVNVDGGTGRFRGATVHSDKTHIAASLSQTLAQFRDLRFVGTASVEGPAPPDSDDWSFSDNGIASIRFKHDPIHDRSQTWHTDQDTFELLEKDELVAAATVLAATLVGLSESSASVKQNAR